MSAVERVCVFALHGGRWTINPLRKSWYYKTSQSAKSLIMQYDCTFEQLVNKVYEVFKVHPFEALVTMKVSFCTCISSSPLKILDDKCGVLKCRESKSKFA